MTFKIC